MLARVTRPLAYAFYARDAHVVLSWVLQVSLVYHELRQQPGQPSVSPILSNSLLPSTA